MIFIEYDKVGVKTQVLGGKTPQICKKNKIKRPKSMGTNKENIKEKNWCKKGRKIKKDASLYKWKEIR